MKRVCAGQEAVADNRSRTCKIETNNQSIIKNYGCNEKFTSILSTPDGKFITNDIHVSNSFIDNENQCVMDDYDESYNLDLLAINGNETCRFHANTQCNKMEKHFCINSSLLDKTSISVDGINKAPSNLFENYKSFSSINNMASAKTCQTICSSSRMKSQQCNDPVMGAMEILANKTVKGVEISKEKSKQIETIHLTDNSNSDDASKIENIFGNRFKNNNNFGRHCIRCNKPLLYSFAENNVQTKDRTTFISNGELKIIDNRENEWHVEDFVEKPINVKCINHQDYSFRIPHSFNENNPLNCRLHSSIKCRSPIFKINCDETNCPEQKYSIYQHPQRKVTFYLSTLNESDNFSNEFADNFKTDNKMTITEDKSLINVDETNTALCSEIIRIRQSLKPLEIINKKKENKSYSTAENKFSAIINAAIKHLPDETFNNSTFITDDEWRSCDEDEDIDNNDDDDDEQLNQVVFPKETRRAMAMLLRASRENKVYQRDIKRNGK